MKGRNLLLLLCVLSFSTMLNAQGFLKASGTSIVNDRGEKIILRGMGLGGWMLQEGYMLRVQGIGQQQHVIRKNIEELIGKEKTNAFYDTWLTNHTRKIDVDSMARWGFNSIRLPMHYNLYTLPVDEEPVPNQNTWIEKGFAITDSLLKWCAANHMYLILDLHAAPGGQGNDLNISDRDPNKPSLWQSEANQEKMIAFWKKLAARYANEPWIGGYDIINEPNWGFEKAEDKNGCGEILNEPLKNLMIRITKAIREVDKNHIVIIEGNCWGNNYSGVLPTWDNNMVLSFHKYWNYNDQASIQKILDLRKQYNVPIWLGESGENSNLWFRDAIHLMEQNEIGWAWWPLKKMGNNNPLEVKVPKNYQKILDYWSKKGTKPTAEESEQGLNEFADNIKLENCIYHKDVIDVMFRQTKTNEVIPFKNFIAKSGATIQAIDYDLGRNRFAYFDNDTANYWVANGKHSAGNNGRVYRNDGVDIAQEANNFYVTNFESSEWLQYTVISSSDKNFLVALKVLTKKQEKLNIECNVKSTEVSLPNTNAQWKEVETKIQLKTGKNIIRIKAQTGGVDFQAIVFK
ncbi:MAG TPA: glycosyl hydrolase family 5 [Cytophagales bacterium]|jgi:endoglucanase|nr:glycosyl hydrolase family 5 [Cytophagales bacterium]